MCFDSESEASLKNNIVILEMLLLVHVTRNAFRGGAVSEKALAYLPLLHQLMVCAPTPRFLCPWQSPGHTRKFSASSWKF